MLFAHLSFGRYCYPPHRILDALIDHFVVNNAFRYNVTHHSIDPGNNNPIMAWQFIKGGIGDQQYFE